MRTMLRSLSAFAAATALASAQDFIQYRFDSPCTTEVVNYATGPAALPANGVLESTSPTSPYTTGVFGGALAAGSTVATTYYNRVRTGWDPGTQPVNGDFTMAFFMRQQTANGSAFYIMGAPSGGVRLFTNGIAGRGLYQRLILASGGNGINASIANDFYLPAAVVDVQTLAAAGWVHVAIVVDATAQTADWYVNGVSVLQLTGVVGGASITAAGPYTVGYYSSTSHFDIDEFLVSLRAYTPAEILALSLVSKGGDGDYTMGVPAQCGTLGLGSTGGAPSIGNATYALQVNTAQTGFYAVLLGFDRCSLGGFVPLPVDGGTLLPLAAGCSLLTDIGISIGGFATGTPATVPFAIPGDQSFAGLNLYSQAVLLDTVSGSLSASNGFAIGLGL
jgi:hypothetical protein